MNSHEVTMSQTSRTLSACQPLVRGVVVGLVLCCPACHKDEPKPSNKIATSAASTAAKPSLPPGVDGPLLGRIRELAIHCEVDVKESNVACKNGSLDTLTQQFSKGARSQSQSLETLAFALAEADEKVVTVSAELLQRAFREPGNDKNAKPTSKETALSLIKTLGKLPGAQAVDAAPAVVRAAMEVGADKELYAVIDAHTSNRVPARAYSYLLAGGGMRGWPKVQELVKDPNVELATAALDAPSKMVSVTPAEQICDWYRGVAEDERPVVATRAGTHLAGCGSDYIEKILTEDNARLADKAQTKLPLGSYRQMCRDAQLEHGAKPEQCKRIKILLQTVLEDKRFDVASRSDALAFLAANFAGDDTSTLASRYSQDKNPELKAAAQAAVTRVKQELAALRQSKPADQPAPSTVKPVESAPQ